MGFPLKRELILVNIAVAGVFIAYAAIKNIVKI
jgi:hypothetical protein